MKKARRLINLDISEISSVDRGAGKGVRVMLMKRNDHMQTADETIFKGLSGLQPVAIAKRAFESVAAGEISEHRFAEIQKQLAVAMFPAAPNEGVALAKFLATAAGAETLRPRTGLGFAQNYELMKAEGNEPRAERAQPDGDNDDDVDKDEVDAMAREHRKKHPELTHPQAVAAILATPQGTEAYRRDKAARLRSA
jgi:hypothetical protein